jgi:putative ABC transport system permease protein
MIVLLKIAIRNLKEHKTKTLIIGIIIAMGVIILVVGNSMIDTATKGLRKNYWDNYTGHIIISGSDDDELTIFGRMSMQGMNDPIPKIPEYQDIQDYVSSHPDVDRVSPQVSGRAIASSSEGEGRVILMLFGIDPEKYRLMFPENLNLVEGGFIKPGSEGILVSEAVKFELDEASGQDLHAGDKILLTGVNAVSGTKIRELTVSGIFHFKQSSPQLDRICIIDIQNIRILNGMTVTSASEINLDENEQAMLGKISEDDLFAGNSGEKTESSSGGALFEEVRSVGEASSEEKLLNILGDTKLRDELTRTDSGAWHFLLIQLKDPDMAGRVMDDINGYFKENSIDAAVSDWLSFAGMSAEMAYALKNIFNIIILIIAVVAVIIIMNTLVISVTERIPEIGTMRAIGAQKGFVRKMIVIETVTISGIFGLVGIALGGIILWVLYVTGIPAPNFFFEVLFGGKHLHPVLSAGAVGLSFIVVGIVGIIASLYPVSVALRIEPVKAMQST